MKKGNTIVESIIALSILLITLTLSVQITNVTKNSIALRKNKEKANRVAYAIENEIKYNISFNELKEVLDKDNICLKYENDILEDLLETPLLLLDAGDEIVIKKVEDESKDEIYKICTIKIEILNSMGGVLTERQFIKSYWMDI